MTCSECQVQIFDGELDRDAVVHLTTCEDCRVLDREVRLNASALAEMREDVMPIRRRVRRWPWLVAAAAAGLVAIGISYRAEPVVVTPQPVAAVVPPEVAAPVAETPAAPKPPAPIRRARPAAPTTIGEPLLVKFLTDDPDVVIYWQIDPIQGEQAL